MAFAGSGIYAAHDEITNADERGRDRSRPYTVNDWSLEFLAFEHLAEREQQLADLGCFDE
jgi:hypothetical protein